MILPLRRDGSRPADALSFGTRCRERRCVVAAIYDLFHRDADIPPFTASMIAASREVLRQTSFLLLVGSERTAQHERSAEVYFQAPRHIQDVFAETSLQNVFVVRTGAIPYVDTAP
jgi:hypothetical protein